MELETMQVAVIGSTEGAQRLHPDNIKQRLEFKFKGGVVSQEFSPNEPHATVLRKLTLMMLQIEIISQA